MTNIQECHPKMTAKATAWALDQMTDTPLAKLVLIAASDVGGWGDGPETICDWSLLESACRMDRKALTQVLEQLVRDGYLTTIRPMSPQSVCITFPACVAARSRA